VEDEDEHSLEGVEYGEEVRHDNRGLIDEEETEGPGETQQKQQSEGPHDPGPEGRQEKKAKTKKRGRIQHERHLVIRQEDEWDLQ